MTGAMNGQSWRGLVATRSLLSSRSTCWRRVSNLASIWPHLTGDGRHANGKESIRSTMMGLRKSSRILIVLCKTASYSKIGCWSMAKS